MNSTLPVVEARSTRAKGVVALTLIIVVGAPIVGLIASGKAISPYLALPPRPMAPATSSFSWIAFSLLATLVLASVAPFVARALSVTPPRAVAPASHFPWWGYAALALVAAGWLLAWTRFSWFAPLQQHTFAPLWLGYIGVVNALVVRRQGHSLMTRRPARFVLLFAVSALFWWIFEYLNRFVGNWRYVGIGAFDAFEYTMFATLSFSTVLPAVASTAEWLRTSPRLQKAFARWHAIRIPHPRGVAVAALMATSASLAALAIFPQYLYPLVWVSPAVIIIAIQAIARRPTVLDAIAHGDWREIVAYAAAALVCGFFWEMWNYGSLARWEYHVPHTQAFHLFEMPLLGYAGYLPFGMECAVIAALVLGGEARRTDPAAPVGEKGASGQAL